MPDDNSHLIALFNYGGGMRGLISAHFMARLEDATGLRMAEMVDIFSGPSTGAILNAALNVRHADRPTEPRFRARHMVRFYEREGIKIFPPDHHRELRGIIHDFNNRTFKLSLGAMMKHGHYDPTHLRSALKALYGTMPLSDSLRSLIIPCYNIDGGQAELVKPDADSPAHTRISKTDPGGRAIWLRNMKTGFPDNAASLTPQVSVYDAVMASCAAPTFFPCHSFHMRWAGSTGNVHIAGIDGNMFDNPCVSYFGAIRPHVPPGRKLIMVVLGTGLNNRSVRKEQWDSFGPLGVVDPVNDLPLINMFFNGGESALMQSFAAELGENLFIFNRSMLDPGDMPSEQIDNAAPENLKRMRDFCEMLLEENKAQFDKLCHILVNRRDERQAEQDGMVRRARKYFSFFSGLRTSDHTAVEDHEAPTR